MAKVKKIFMPVMLIGVLVIAGLAGITSDVRAAVTDYEKVWEATFGGSGKDAFYSIAATPDGGCVVVGTSMLETGALMGLGNGESDAIIAKYSSTGVLQWAKNFGGSEREDFRSVVLASDGGYVAVGSSDSADGDLAGLNNGDYDAIIVKYSSTGVLQWAKNFGGSDYDYFYSVASTPDGGYVAVGSSDSADDDLVGLNEGSRDAIIAKYSSTGTLQWAKNFGGSEYDSFNSVALASDGGFVAVGYSESDDGDLTGLNKGDDDAIIVKFSSTGIPQWNKNFGGSGYDYFHSVASTADGGYVVAGRSSSTDGDLVGLNIGNISDAIIIKFSSNGTVEWKRKHGGVKGDAFTSVAVTVDGGYAVAGVGGFDKGMFGDAVLIKYMDTTPPPPPIPPVDPPSSGLGGAIRFAGWSMLGLAVLSAAAILVLWAPKTKINRKGLK